MLAINFNVTCIIYSIYEMLSSGRTQTHTHTHAPSKWSIVFAADMHLKTVFPHLTRLASKQVSLLDGKIDLYVCS